MDEKSILKISIVAIIIGMVFLFFYSGEIDIQAVERIDTAIPEETVEMSGVVSRVTQMEKVAFIELVGERKEKVDVIIFKDDDIFLKEGDLIEVSGTVEEYEGKKEIIANSVVLK
jgi:aspartyl/asparaginyl-tRNA synthetase